MTNRGLSIHLNITPWSADTYLAYLECSTRRMISGSLKSLRIGIYLRRLSEDDQYARIDLNGEDLLFIDEDLLAESDRPTLARQLFIRSDVNIQEEQHCLADRLVD